MIWRYRQMRKLAASLSLFVAALAGAAPASLHAGFWIGETPRGDEFKCEGVATQRQMVHVLRRAGWEREHGIPQIDWRKYEAVVVSPSIYYKSAHLAFYGLVRERNSIILRYGWEPIKSVVHHRPGVTTLGSSVPGYAATIVVWYRRGLDSEQRFFCSNLEVVRR